VHGGKVQRLGGNQDFPLMLKIQNKDVPNEERELTELLKIVVFTLL
jgi:hypothetical protein